MPIRYENTDLDLVSTGDVNALAEAFKAGGVRPLHVTLGCEGRWYSILETSEQFLEPEPNIAAMLAVVESLNGPLRLAWEACTLREFNIGYTCGRVPWAYNEVLSPEIVRRVAEAGASLRVTLYPWKSIRKVRSELPCDAPDPPQPSE